MLACNFTMTIDTPKRGKAIVVPMHVHIVMTQNYSNF